jgi:hypothetical protein
VSGRRGKQPNRTEPAALDRRPPWAIVYAARDDGISPGLTFLDACPGKVDAEFGAVLDAVAGAPPPAFSGGGKWEAMHGDMGGYYEIRLTGPGREQFRLFCLLENGTDAQLTERGLHKPALAVITGLRKPWRTTLSANDYAGVRKLGDAYLARLPRRVAT